MKCELWAAGFKNHADLSMFPYDGGYRQYL